jgi:hypothetical protein
MKRFLAMLALFFAMTLSMSAKEIGTPKGFDKKVYDATYALYATRASHPEDDPRFICTVTAVQKFHDGYLFLGAGHCTSANPELPTDLKYYIATDVGKAVVPVELLRAKMEEDFDSDAAPVKPPLDYAVFYLKAPIKLETIGLGDEGDLSVGSPTINVNFSLGQAKYTSPGLVSSLVAHSGAMNGFFGVQMFASSGASGSSVVDTKTKKVVGLVIAEAPGRMMPMWIEPISSVESDMSGVNIDKLIATPETPNAVSPKPNFFDLGSGDISLDGFHGQGNGSRSSQHSSGSRSGESHAERPHEQRPSQHPKGREIDHEVFARHFGHDHLFRPEVYYNGGFYSFEFAGIWFDYEDMWLYPADDVFIDLDADGFYYMCSPAHPGVRVQVWIP